MRTRGFTLLELLVALVMLSAVTTLAYTSLNTSMRTIERREAHARSLHRGHFILRHITEHLQSVHADREAYYRLSAESELALFVGDSEKLAFWTRSQPHARRSQPGGLVHLTYETTVDEAEEVTEDAEPQTVLLVEARGDLAGDAEPVARWTLPVESVLFEYFDGEAWGSFWDIETQEALPKGVRVAISLPTDGPESNPLTLSSTIPVHVSATVAFEPDEDGQTGDALEPEEDPDAE